jgi:ammonia channel protein AmtB
MYGAGMVDAAIVATAVAQKSRLVCLLLIVFVPPWSALIYIPAGSAIAKFAALQSVY